MKNVKLAVQAGKMQYSTRPIRKEKRVGRNALCPCNSGLKFKKCCGKPVQPANPVPFEYRDMRSLYSPEQKDAALAFVYRWGIVPNPEQLRVAMEESDDDQVAMIVKLVSAAGDCNPAYIEGIKIARRLATPRNQHLWAQDDIDAYVAAMQSTGFYQGEQPAEKSDEPVYDASSETIAPSGPDRVSDGEVQGSPAG